MTNITSIFGGKSPALQVPADLSNTAQLQVYDGFPLEEAWAQEILERVQVCAHPRDAEAVVGLTPLETGAPVGPFMHESYRIARAVGLVTPEGAAPAALGSALGACVAQGMCYAKWKHTAEASFLVICFSAPHAFGWGAGKSGLSQEHLKARCLHQYAHQARSLLANVADCASAASILVEFDGEWGPETENIRRGLATTCVLCWQSEVLQEAAVVQELFALAA